jgi:hypothetical protein
MKGFSRAFFVLSTIVLTVAGDGSDHKYKQGEHVELWVNKVRSK